MLLAAIQ